MATRIYFPEMGEGVIEGKLTRWLVSEGQQVAQYDPIAELETDKVTTEISSEVTGTILKLCAGEGETVAVHSVLAYVGNPGEEVPDDDAGAGIITASSGRRSEAQTLTQMPAEVGAGYGGRISPLVGRIASEHQIDLALVSGTGRDGRVTKDDILTYIKQREQALSTDIGEAEVEKAELGEETHEEASAEETARLDEGDELLPMTGMRQAIAEHMVRSKHTSPHATTVFEFDFSAVAAHRSKYREDFARDGANLTFTVYIVSAIVRALKQHRLVNSVWSDKGIVLKRAINIGMAAAVPGGLVVPVIHHADGMSLLGLAQAINDLTEKARSKQLKAEDLEGGTFSLTNHGTTGSLFATPIINQPQAAILGIGKIEKRVKVIDNAIAIRPLAFASLSFDHRILDGATADAFVGTVKDVIEKWAN